MVSKKEKASAKKAKQVSLSRTRDERLVQVTNLRTKLLMFGFPQSCDGMIEIEKMFNEYIERGESISGKVSFAAWDRIAEIILPMRRDRETNILLRYVGKATALPLDFSADRELVSKVTTSMSTPAQEPGDGQKFVLRAPKIADK